MKAVRYHEFGGPEVLKLEDVEDLEPGPGEVRLKVGVCALNHLDVDLREGISRFPVSLPGTLGLEIVGTIDKLGPEVDGAGWDVGERAMPYLLGGTRFLGVEAPGGYAEMVTCPPEQLVRVPEEISDEDAGALQVAFATAWHMLFTRGGLRIGETVLVNSVGSGIGSAAVQLAALAGAYVIGTAGSDEKLERATDLGMHEGINYNEQDVPAEVARITGGEGVDLVYEHVGGQRFKDGIGSLKRDGRLVTCGAHSGEVVDFDIIPFFRSQHTVIGSFVYEREELEKVLQFARRGLIKPQVHRVFPLDEARAAMEMLERRECFGKILLAP
jgi:NADPH:quinone reductase-like Zn-dependent oxidoreductase